MESTTPSSTPTSSWQPAIAFVIGVLVAFGAGRFLTADDSVHVDDHNHEQDHAETEVHVHSDFIVFLDGSELDLSDDKYMSAANQVLHDSIHIHDNDDRILHRHAENITLADFFESLGFILTDTCFTTDAGEEYCSDEDNELILLVNGERVEQPSKYINQDNDRFLLYYGDEKDQATIDTQFARITDEACIYSLTCPERGTPPPESCGLTCEI